MLKLSYTITPGLKTSLDTIADLRAKILLTSISPKTELRLRWDAMLDRLHYSLSLSKQPLSRRRIAISISASGKKAGGQEEREIFRYKRALDFISNEWLASPNQIRTKSILELYNKLADKKVGSGRGSSFHAAEKSLQYFLDYLQSYPENPVIQAAIAHVELLDIKPFASYNNRFSRLLSYLFLYKHGYDIRGLVVIESSWFNDIASYLTAVEDVLHRDKLTNWLEYFARSLALQLGATLQVITVSRFAPDVSNAFWKLTERQKEIINRLEKPGESITNRRVQEIFSVSQITASRDLSKLATLGLVFSHGRGRSVYYTRA